MATIRFILGIICLVSTLGNGLLNRHLLNKQQATNALRTRVLAIAKSQLGVREVGGNNNGTAVKAYLAYTNLEQGYPWCAAFVSWVYGKASLAQPKTAWSPALFPAKRLTKTPKPADVFGIYFPKLKRIAHCGLVLQTKADWVLTIEGNTNLNGGNDGDGVYRKWRHKKTIALYAQWLPQKGSDHE